jgi:hypothetical protein
VDIKVKVVILLSRWVGILRKWVIQVRWVVILLRWVDIKAKVVILVILLKWVILVILLRWVILVRTNLGRDLSTITEVNMIEDNPTCTLLE